MNDKDLNKDTIYEEGPDSPAAEWIDASGSGRDENADPGTDSIADTSIADPSVSDPSASDTSAADTAIAANDDTGTEDLIDSVGNTDGEKRPDGKRKAKGRKKKKNHTGKTGPVRRNWFVKFLLCCCSFFLVFGIINH